MDSPTPTPTPEAPSAVDGVLGADPVTPEGEPTPEPEDVDALKRAIAAERKRSERAERELAELRKSQMSESEAALAEAKAVGRAEALTEVNGRLLAAEVRAHAADKLADPGDAVRLLDLDDLTNGDGGPDAKAIDAAIETLVKAKPYLAKQQSPAPAKPNRLPQGPRESADSTADDFIRRAVRGPVG